jgi:hypothetical protein
MVVSRETAAQLSSALSWLECARLTAHCIEGARGEQGLWEPLGLERAPKTVGSSDVILGKELPPTAQRCAQEVPNGACSC